MCHCLSLSRVLRFSRCNSVDGGRHCGSREADAAAGWNGWLSTGKQSLQWWQDSSQAYRSRSEVGRILLSVFVAAVKGNAGTWYDCWVDYGWLVVQIYRSITVSLSRVWCCHVMTVCCATMTISSCEYMRQLLNVLIGDQGTFSSGTDFWRMSPGTQEKMRLFAWRGVYPYIFPDTWRLKPNDQRLLIMDLLNETFWMLLLSSRFTDLHEPVAERRSQLEDSERFHQFHRNAEDELAWLREHMAIASSKEYGSSLTGVQNMIKKMQVGYFVFQDGLCFRLQICARARARVCVCVCACTCERARTCKCVRVPARARVCVSMWLCVHVCVHVYCKSRNFQCFFISVISVQNRQT